MLKRLPLLEAGQEIEINWVPEFITVKQTYWQLKNDKAEGGRGKFRSGSPNGSPNVGRAYRLERGGPGALVGPVRCAPAGPGRGYPCLPIRPRRHFGYGQAEVTRAG